MRIKVWDDKYVITADKYCYNLREIKTKLKTDEMAETIANEDGTYEVIIAYPTTLQGCLESILEREERVNKCTTIEGYIKHLEKIHAKFDEMLSQLTSIMGGKERIEYFLHALPREAE